MTYSSGHPWYYLLGGKVLPPRKILQDAIACKYQGYARDDIAAIDKKSEPVRSESLRKLKAKFYADYKQDLSRYRELACQLHKYRVLLLLYDCRSYLRLEQSNEVCQPI